MSKTLAARIVLTCVAAWPTAAVAADPEPRLTIPWRQEGGPTLNPPGPETPPLGPTALAVSNDALWVADPADSELVRIALDGKVTAEAAPLKALDVVAAADGEVALLGDGLDKFALRSKEGKWEVASLPATEAPPRRLAFAADGSLWLGLSDGAAVRLRAEAATPSVEGKRAIPLPGPAAHVWTRVVEEKKAVVWIWPWDAEAAFQSPRARKVTVETVEPIGSVRPLAHDKEGGLTVLVELIAGEQPLRVHTEARLFDSHGRVQSVVRWEAEEAAPAYRSAAVDPDGTLWLMRSTQDGLRLFRIAPESWPGAGGAKP
jgi:hypothetical protein